MLVASERCRELIKKYLHRLGVRIRPDEREAVVGARLDAREDVGEREALVAQARRALAARPPDMGCSTLLADPRFVLEEQPDALIFVRLLNSSQQSRGSF